jgi:hypothetical protein
MAIFNSYVKLPEGKKNVHKINPDCKPYTLEDGYHVDLAFPSHLDLP